MKQLARSQDFLQKRTQVQYHLDFDDSLPIYAWREDIEKQLRQHQVLIICGETGSGKTTQIPKICLAMGLGRRGLIGHTQTPSFGCAQRGASSG